MKIHEHQAKEIFARYGVPVPRGIVARTAAEAERAAETLLAETRAGVVVVKAQIHAGGRGKGGGVKVVRQGAAEAGRVAAAMLGHALVTHQTGPSGQTVRRVYIEQGLAIARELYLAMVVDRDARRIAVMASTEGGMEIEEVATKSPGMVHTQRIEPLVGLSAYQMRRLGFAMGLGKDLTQKLVRIGLSMYELFLREDCSLSEVNPLVVTEGGAMVALDAKIVLDDNADVRHPEWAALRDADEEDPLELEAKRAGLSYVALDGEIGCLVNGAGLAMATMDIIQHYGGRPANFLDVGGGAKAEQVAKAFSMILTSPKVKGIFVNIFGGIMKCDVIAAGIIAATKTVGLSVPLVVRLEGTNVEGGRKLLAESGLSIHAASSMADGASRIVGLIQG
jgi:succinyl-CoA synthetase beta subunit